MVLFKSKTNSQVNLQRKVFAKCQRIEYFLHVQRNVFGAEIAECSSAPLTGFYRDGCCNTGPDDRGMHTICVEVNEKFLRHQLEQGNDLITPRPQFSFDGLKPGDRWCVCLFRWLASLEAKCEAPIYLNSTHESVLKHIKLEELTKYALD